MLYLFLDTAVTYTTDVTSSLPNSITQPPLNTTNTSDVNWVQLKCALSNVRSVVNKFNDIKCFMSTNNIDVFGITETMLSFDYPDSLLSYDEAYRIFRKDKRPT